MGDHAVQLSNIAINLEVPAGELMIREQIEGVARGEQTGAVYASHDNLPRGAADGSERLSRDRALRPQRRLV